MKKRPSLKSYEHNLTAANGQSLKVMGTAELRYVIGKKAFNWETIIVQNLRSSLIIGVDLMHHHNVSINVGKRLITVEGSGSVPDSSVNLDPSIGRSSKEYSINSQEAARIEINTLEVPGTRLMVKGPFIEEGVCEVNHLGRATVLLTNRTCEQITVKGKTPLCRIEPVSPDACDGPLTEQIYNACVHPGGRGGTPPHLTDEILAPVMKNIPLNQKARFSQLLRQYALAFSKTDDEIGTCPVVKQKIELLDPNQITSKAPYRIPDALRPVAQEYVDKLLAQGVIENSFSPFSSPLLLVKKAGASDPTLPVFRRYRCVVDYRSLNLNVKKDRYPLTDADHLIDLVASGEVLTTIDVSAGFFNQLLEEGSKEYTAFSASGIGHYQFRKSPQGICNSPSAFSRMMAYVLRNLKNVEIYVDDIVIVSPDFDSHYKTLEEVLQRFCQYGLKIRVNKMQLGASEVEYLGFQISKGKGIRPGFAKTEAIKNWKPPTDVRQVKQFIGLCSYFRRVCKDFSIIAKPLTVLTRKDSKYQKGPLPEDALQAFRRLQHIFSTRPALAAVNSSSQFILITDASSIGAGAILAQRDQNGLERPVAYASKTWSESEARRATFHLEASALLFGARRFKHYLVGRPVIFKTDHRPLVSLDKTSSPVLDRIYAELQEYDFTMEYLKGTEMPADGLSRSALNSIEKKTPAIKTDPCEGLNVERVRNLQKQDKWIRAVVCKLQYGLDPDNSHLKEWVDQVSSQVEIHEGLVGIRKDDQFRILAPLDLRHTLLAIGHDEPLSGHQGFAKTYDRLKNSWFWPKMKEEVENYTHSCQICSENNVPNYHTRMPLRPLPEAKYVGARLNIDLVGPYPSDVNGNRYALVMVDAFSNFVRIAPQPTKETEVTALSLLNHWVCNHSVPTTIHSDHGGEFSSAVMKHLTEKLGIYRHVFSSPYHPQSNAKVERANRSLVTYIRKFLEGNGDKWSELIPAMVFSFNTGLHEGKMMSAHQIVYGTRPTLPTDVVNPRHNYSEVPFEQMLQRHHQIQDEVRHRQKMAFEKQKRAFDKTSQAREFRPGMIVYIARPKKGLRHQKFQSLYMGPYVISETLGNDNFSLKHTESGRKVVSHANRLKYGTAREQIIRNNVPSHIQDGEKEDEEERDNEERSGEREEEGRRQTDGEEEEEEESQQPAAAGGPPPRQTSPVVLPSSAEKKRSPPGTERGATGWRARRAHVLTPLRKTTPRMATRKRRWFRVYIMFGEKGRGERTIC